MVFDRLFGWTRKKTPDPAIPFGRYSDNNKSVEKVGRWTAADNFFKQKDYQNCLNAFFDYLRDDDQQNVIVERKEDAGSFQIYQGSKLIRGNFNPDKLQAEIVLAKMPAPSVPAMRRLLEMNFKLYYSRYALQEDRLCMRFDTTLATASPNKLYYGLKELATMADKQDDLLLEEFASLQSADMEHIAPIPEKEQEIKYTFLQNWIKSTLDYIDTLDAQKFSGGISYLLLTLLFRIDYLIRPEGKILYDLEKIAGAYYSKEDKSAPERNPPIIEALREIQKKNLADFSGYLFRSKHTFAIVPPHNYKAIAENMETAAQNMLWYRDNNYPDLANKVIEYGFAYNQYSYSLPKPLSDLFLLFMQVNYTPYFTALGFSGNYYDAATNDFDINGIRNRIEEIMEIWKPKYPGLVFKTKKLKFDNLVNFNHSFSLETAQLHFE